MLVITAQADDIIEIGDNCKIFVTKCGSKMRLGFDVPEDLKVVRYPGYLGKPKEVKAVNATPPIVAKNTRVYVRKKSGRSADVSN